MWWEFQLYPSRKRQSLKSFDEFQVLKSSPLAAVDSLVMTVYPRKSVEGHPTSASLAVPPRWT